MKGERETERETINRSIERRDRESQSRGKRERRLMKRQDKEK